MVQCQYYAHHLMSLGSHSSNGLPMGMLCCRFEYNGAADATEEGAAAGQGSDDVGNGARDQQPGVMADDAPAAMVEEQP